jgi:hypothetical protein
LPFNAGPGDTSADSLRNTNVAEAGATLNETLLQDNNDFGIGLTDLNTAYAISTSTDKRYTLGAPTVYEDGFLVRDSIIQRTLGSRPI